MEGQPVDASRRRIQGKAISIGIATGAYALSFGAISVATGLDVWQTQMLSLFMFTGASQFAFVGIIGAGGGMVAAVLTALLLGARNGMYAVSMAPLLRLKGGRRLVGAHVTIDETTAMALAHPQHARYAFWTTALWIYLLWNAGTLMGALGAQFIGDPSTLGLDAATAAALLALLWPRLVDRQVWAIAIASAGIAIVLTPVLRPGLPVLAAAVVAIGAAALSGRGGGR
ncbi:MAG: AzlC family ABC transporter permease [Candidatus Nanopelagicales bacterium]|nr:AzlC family ABC transporter permease [Actinomycetota bacterium]